MISMSFKAAARYLLSFFFVAMSINVPATLAASIQSDDTKLLVNTPEGKLELSLITKRKAVLELSSLKLNYAEASSWTMTGATENTITLRGEFPAKVDFYKHASDTQSKYAIVNISKVPGGFRVFSEPEWGRQTTIELEDLGSKIFGLSEALHPDNRLSPNLRGASVKVEVNYDPASIGENYASAFSAFFMSSNGYASFFDTFATGLYDIAINSTHRIHHNTGKLDWYLFTGADGAEIHKGYFELIGQPKAVPAWGLGPVGWRDQNDGGAPEILDDIEKMNALEIPFTAWFVDRPYSDGAHAWSHMNFNENFKNPGDWINKIQKDYGLEFMTWTATAFFGDPILDKHLAGHFSYLDLSHPESVQSFKSNLKEKQYRFGVKGHKIDRADEHLPVYEPWHDESVDPLFRRNTYAYLMAKMHDEALQEAWGEDQVSFARSAIHRSQPYLSAIWAGDPRTSWEGLRANFANAARSSFMGFPVWGTDVGGYQGEGFIPEDLYIRWMQAGSMTGLFEIKLDGAGGDGRDRMPWRYDDEFQALFKKICDDRMMLLPYLYSLARTSGKTGPLMQPLAYRHLADEKTHENWDQFYVGDAILVAPVFEQALQREVYLPAGQWRDYDDATQQFKGGKSYKIDAPLSKLPRFVKANSVYVSGKTYAGNNRIWDKEENSLTVHAFPSKTNAHTSFEYIDMLDTNQSKTISMESKKNMVAINLPSLSHALSLEVALLKKPKGLTVNGQQLELEYSEEKGMLSLSLKPEQDYEVQIQL